MTPKLTFMILFFSLAFVDGSYADYNNPTSDADCNMYSDRYDFSSRRRSLSQQISQCLKQPKLGRWISVPHCGHGGSERCAPLESQRCQLENHMRALREMCRARLQTHRAREREKELAQEQAKRERDKFLLEAARHGATWDGLDPGLKPTQDLVARLRDAGRVAGHLIGATPQNAGALHLSAALTTAGLRVTQAIQTAALERLNEVRAELQQANPSRDDIGNFGKPTPGRKEAATQLIRDLEALERQIAHAVTLVEQGLPLGGASAVVGDGAEHLIELVYARANGLLTRPLSETSLDVAIEAARPGGSAAALTLIEPDTGPSRHESDVSGQLRHRRAAALNDVQGRIESQRRADAERERREKDRLAEGRKLEAQRQERRAAERRAEEQTQARRKELDRGINQNRRVENKVPAANCLKIYPRPGASAQKIFYNMCSYNVFIECAESDGYQLLYSGKENTFGINQCREYFAYIIK